MALYTAQLFVFNCLNIELFNDILNFWAEPVFSGTRFKNNDNAERGTFVLGTTPRPSFVSTREAAASDR